MTVCDWLPTKGSEIDATSLKALVITDLHLLGHRKSFWFEKWRREWQMYQSFKAIITLHKPEVVFVLGDLFDEGEYCTNEEFTEHVERFHNTFPLPHDIPMYITVGNHDIGFHNNIKPGSAERFSEQLKSPSVRLLSIKNNHFVLINSLALEGDSCRMCREARSKINNVSDILKCSANKSCDTNYDVALNYSRPIMLQHFPLYRLSDAVCSEPDAAPLSEKYIPFRLKIDALSKEATDDIIAKLKPRAAFGGHTHYGCLLHHSYNYEDENIDFYEHSVPSFNMRNIFEPKYMLVTITPDEYAANKCSLPREVTIIITTVVLLIATVWFTCRRRPFRRGLPQMRKYSLVK
ncbi:metallophosphoesterase 1-like isoform X2 [Plodia interpunctella]|uniref:metallophosphoesterase 1-like isoform X2 n=1 Tax=Plodia interpunctella TaxID=58824 RepID=UPI002368E232|nr:metallophosphoesterase 1-like isoform X2 [Plodia interpunctella]